MLRLPGGSRAERTHAEHTEEMPCPARRAWPRLAPSRPGSGWENRSASLGLRSRLPLGSPGSIWARRLELRSRPQILSLLRRLRQRQPNPYVRQLASRRPSGVTGIPKTARASRASQRGASPACPTAPAGAVRGPPARAHMRTGGSAHGAGCIELQGLLTCFRVGVRASAFPIQTLVID